MEKLKRVSWVHDDTSSKREGKKNQAERIKFFFTITHFKKMSSSKYTLSTTPHHNLISVPLYLLNPLWSFTFPIIHRVTFFIFSSIPKVKYYGLVLGEPHIYHHLWDFTRSGDFTWRVVKMILLLTEYRYWSNRYGRK